MAVLSQDRGWRRLGGVSGASPLQRRVLHTQPGGVTLPQPGEKGPNNPVSWRGLLCILASPGRALRSCGQKRACGQAWPLHHAAGDGLACEALQGEPGRK